MAVTVHKAGSKAAESAVLAELPSLLEVQAQITSTFAESALKSEVDQIYQIDRTISKMEESIVALKATLKSKMEPLMEHIDVLYNAEDKVTLQGFEHMIELSAKGMKVTNIDKATLRAELGEDSFDDLWAIGVGDIRKYLNPKQIAKVLTEERIAARRMKVLK